MICIVIRVWIESGCIAVDINIDIASIRELWLTLTAVHPSISNYCSVEPSEEYNSSLGSTLYMRQYSI